VTLQNKTDNKSQNKAQNKGQKVLSPEADLVRRFMRYLKLDRNYSVNTQEAYSHDLGYFMRFLHEHHLSPLEVKLEDLEQFLQFREVRLETAVAIDAGLTYAQQVKVWSVYYLNLSHFCQQMINFDTKLKIKRDIAKQNR
jgi:site-specific recombinase XerD